MILHAYKVQLDVNNKELDNQRLQQRREFFKTLADTYKDKPIIIIPDETQERRR